MTPRTGTVFLPFSIMNPADGIEKSPDAESMAANSPSTTVR